MQINAININFGKKLSATCNIKDKERIKHSTSIYEYNPRSFEDMKEIHSADISNSIKQSFFKEGYFRRYLPESKYYAMKDDETGEIIACIKTSTHYSLKGKYKGYYTSIDEFEADDNYINIQTPMMAFISDKAQKTLSKNIITAQRDYEIPNLGETKFKKTKEGFWVLRSKGFNECILRAEKRNNLEIIA